MFRANKLKEKVKSIGKSRGMAFWKNELLLSDLKYCTQSESQKYMVRCINIESCNERLSITGNFEEVRGVAVDNQGAIYVADTGHHRILKFTKEGELECETKNCSTGGRPTLERPYSIMIKESEVYVCDREHQQIMVYDRSLRNPFSLSLRDDPMMSPKYIAYHDNRYYVVGDPSNIVVIFEKIEEKINRVSYYKYAKKKEGKKRLFMGLRSIAIFNGMVYVTESTNNYVVIFRTSGEYEDEVLMVRPLIVEAYEDSVYVSCGADDGCAVVNKIYWNKNSNR